jgi:hypothetical protein
MSRLDREESVTAGRDSLRRRLRLGLREFLLLVTLASIVVAAFALRARTVRDEEAVEHLFFHARRARVSADWWRGRIAWEQQRLDERPKITEEWLEGCEARLLPPDEDPSGTAATGKSLFIALNTTFVPSIWIGVYDEDGRRILEHLDASKPMHDLLGRLARPGSTVELAGVDKRSAVALAAAILAEYEHGLQEGLKTARAHLAQEIAEAERHEREAGAR